MLYEYELHYEGIQMKIVADEIVHVGEMALILTFEGRVIFSTNSHYTIRCIGKYNEE